MNSKISKINIENIEIQNNTLTTFLTSNNTNKTKIGKILKSKYSNSILLSEIPNNIYKIKNSNVESLLSKLKMNDLLDYSFRTLSIGQKQILQILYAINSEYDVIILNNALSMIAPYNKKTILNILKRSKNKTIINLTNDKEDIIYGKRTILVDNNEIVLNSATTKIVSDEKIFKQIGFELPFMASLSLKLKYYNLVEKPILNMDRMVNKLWK